MAELTTALIGIYTLTPLHMGTGQATAAVDLPVARESHTGLPVIPATGIKGRARDGFEEALGKKNTVVRDLFGPDLEAAGGADGQAGRAGGLVFSEAQLVALPLRSLNLPLAWCTSRMVLERLARNLEAFGCRKLLAIHDMVQVLDPEKLYVSRKIAAEIFTVEDMAFTSGEVDAGRGDVIQLAKQLATLLPGAAEQDGTVHRFVESLVIVPDLEFQRLVERGLPVQARIKLKDDKTNDNLWYEESVAPDTLFASFVLNRPGSGRDMVAEFVEQVRSRREPDLGVVQLGGNETVGNGWCWWNLRVAHVAIVSDNLELNNSGAADRRQGSA